jgi:nucleoside 2-deoxyribosyltransferase
MKVYFAGSFKMREIFQQRSTEISLKFKINCSWMFDESINKTHQSLKDLNNFNSLDNFDKGRLSINAQLDLREIQESDILIFDATGVSTGGGKWVELGYAIASNKIIYAIMGEQDEQVGSRSIFCYYPTVMRFKSWDDLKSHLLQINTI